MLLDQNLDEPASETFDSLRAAFWEEVCLGFYGTVSRWSASWKNVGNPMETSWARSYPLVNVCKCKIASCNKHTHDSCKSGDSLEILMIFGLCYIIISLKHADTVHVCPYITSFWLKNAGHCIPAIGSPNQRNARLTPLSRTYCWWQKSWTTKDDYPIIYRVLTIPGGAGFRPSTVSCLSTVSSTWNTMRLLVSRYGHP